MIKTPALNQKIILLILISFFGIIYMVQVILNHYYFRTFALDYGFYNQALWDFAHFRINANTVMEPPLENYFQIHPGFTLLLLSPLYHVFTPIFGTYSLLIIQNFFILFGGYCVFQLIYRKTNDFWIAILAFLHFNLIWGHYSALSSDFIETTIGASMVPVFLLLFDKRRFIPATLVFLFIITCKENMPIWFIFISLLLIFIYKDRTCRCVAFSFGVFSVIYLILIFKIFIPYFEIPGRPYWGFNYSVLGSGPAEALKFVFVHPIEFVKLMFVNHLGEPFYDKIKPEFYFMFLASGGLLLFRRPVYLIPFIPIIAQKVLNDGYGRWGITGFYSIEVVSILTVFAFLATAGIKKSVFKYILYGVLCVTTLVVTLKKMYFRQSVWYTRNKECLYCEDFYHTDMDVVSIRKQIDKWVPKDAALAGTQGIIPHYAFRDKIYIFPYIHDAEYITLLKKGNTYPLTEKKYRTTMEQFLRDPSWNVISEDDDLIILKRNDL
jgi:uncharacterized membrane protein